jgi:hypothetical protein
MIDNNRQVNNEPSNKGVFSVSEVAVFKDSPILVYLYKKTEKLVSALYMLSSFISDKEPIKWQMREAGVSLLSQSLSLSDRSSSERILAYNNFISSVLKFISFLEVSYAGGVISEMNFKILKFEFESLIQAAESSEKWSDSKGLVFSEHFFDVARVQSSGSELATGTLENSKGQNAVSDRLSFRKPAKDNVTEIKVGHKKDKGNRQELILGLLKKNKELGIKDFTTTITDCSEKTIQRELAILVLKGSVVKEGEKRWSRYSLK